MKTYTAFIQRNGIAPTSAMLAYLMHQGRIDNYLVEDDRAASGGYRATVKSDRLVPDLPADCRADPWEAV